MRAHGSKFGVKTRPQNRQKLEKAIGKIKIFLAQKSNFLHSKFDFLQWLSDFREIRENLLQRLSNFFDAFLISVTAFKFRFFLNGFPIFLNGFPLSKKSGKNLSTAANTQKIAIRASYFPLPSFLMLAN